MPTRPPSASDVHFVKCSCVSIVKDLIFLMRRSQVSDGCQSLMLQTLESQIHRFDENLECNPLSNLLETSSLSRTGQRNLADLTDITVTNNLGIC